MDRLLRIMVGTAGGIATAYVGGFLGAIGEDKWQAIKRRFSAPLPKAVRAVWLHPSIPIDDLRWVPSLMVEKTAIENDAEFGRVVYRIKRFIPEHLMTRACVDRQPMDPSPRSQM